MMLKKTHLLLLIATILQKAKHYQPLLLIANIIGEAQEAPPIIMITVQLYEKTLRKVIITTTYSVPSMETLIVNIWALPALYLGIYFILWAYHLFPYLHS